jgi:hypothetical protein
MIPEEDAFALPAIEWSDIQEFRESLDGESNRMKAWQWLLKI